MVWCMFLCLQFLIKKNSYLTSNTNRSDRLQCSGACGGIGWACADINADNGAHFESATSNMQSHKATTKFNLARVSLCDRSRSVSTGKSGAWKVSGCWSSKLTSLLKNVPPVAPPISGNVNARVPSNGWWKALLFSIKLKLGLSRVGILVRAPDTICGGIVAECRIGGDCCVVGLICHKYGASGGDSDSEPPDVERRRLPGGGEPMANCTAGGEMELMSTADGTVAGAVFAIFVVLLFRWSERFMLMGCERGIAFDMDLGGEANGGRDNRRTLDGSGTGFGSDIGNVLGRGGLACDDGELGCWLVAVGRLL